MGDKTRDYKLRYSFSVPQNHHHHLSPFVPSISIHTTPPVTFFSIITVSPFLFLLFSQKYRHFLLHLSVPSLQFTHLRFSPSLQFTTLRFNLLLLCSPVYIMTSLFGFLLFSNVTLDDFLVNFDKILGVPFSYQLNDVVRVSYALHLMLLFPIVFHPLRLNLDALFFPTYESLLSDNVRFSWITIGLNYVVFLAANFIPSIWDAFRFTEATTAVCIGFIFPAFIALRDAYGITTMKNKLLSVFMIGLAVFASSVAIYSDAYTLFKRTPSPRA